jgi:hypothetical protein
MEPGLGFVREMGTESVNRRLPETPRYERVAVSGNVEIDLTNIRLLTGQGRGGGE